MIDPVGPVCFRMLGPLEVRAGEAWSGIGAPKWRSLLAALLLHPGQPVSTDQLIAEVWGEQPPAKAANLVSIYVHRLRRLLGDADGSILATRAPGYQIVIPPEAVDAGLFDALSAQGQRELAAGHPDRAASLLAEALGLWHGHALADVPASPLVTAEAGRLEESRIEALQSRIEADLGCGRSAQMVPEVGRLLADHPLREGLWALLMQALHRAGRHAEALEAYARAREVIADELGVDPGAELQQLYQDILTAGPARPAEPQTGPGPDGPAVPGESAGAAGPAVALPPAQLPADIADFTGRDGQVAELRQLLSADDGQLSPGAVPVVLIVGSGGLGKTALAVHAAHLTAGQFPDGQLYASLLGASQPASPADILARFLRDLGMDGANIGVGEEERGAQYRTRLAGRRVLIVLDDARDAAQVLPLLPGSASCAVLITSRRRLPELVGTSIIDLDVLPPAEARSLFARVASEQRARAEPGATDEVLAACAGLPLAIRIAGARLASRGGWNVRTLAGRLANERRRLDELRAGNLAVRACFEVSFASLAGAGPAGSLDPARAFRLLGVWPGPSIALPAAAALLGRDSDAVAEATEVLIDANLLDSPMPEVYRFHDLLRVYAADRAREQESAQDCADAMARLLTWYLHTADAVARIVSPHREQVPLGPPGPGWQPLAFAGLDEALDWCEAERANLVRATSEAARLGMHDIAWKLPVAMMSAFNRRGYWTDWIAMHQIGLESARALGDRRGEAWVLNNLGMVYGLRRMDEAISYLERALEIRREIGDSTGEAQSANNLADTYLLLGRCAEALGPLERALTLQRELGHAYGEAVALNNLGEAYLGLDRLDEAIDRLGQSLQRFRAIGEARGEGYALTNLGEAYLGLGRLDEAVDRLGQALAIRRSLGDRHGEAMTLSRLSEAQVRAGRDADGLSSRNLALALFTELGDEVQVARLASRPAA